jgi:hypothetical protein
VRIILTCFRLVLAACTCPTLRGAPPPPTADEVVEQRRALREFDRFLDHHPLLEDEMRLKPALRCDPHYLEANPELRSFLAHTPNLTAGLLTYPRYFLYRALLRVARAPLTHAEIARLSELFDRAPEIEHALTLRPAAIREPAFLATQPALREFLQQHPPLDRAFLP